MPPEKADPGRLYHILEAAEAVRRFTAGKSFDASAGDLMLRSAVERQVGIIKEAASKLSTALREANPQVPWDKIIRTRHILVHDYDRVQLDTLWPIVTDYVPSLIEQVRPLIPPPRPDPEPEDG
jgi:uncharacterized protein with HEPN domain